MSSIYRQNSHSSYVSSTTLPSPVMRRNSSGVPKKNTLLELSTQVISRTSTNNDGQSSIVFLDSVDGGDNNSNGGGVDGAGEEEEVVAEDENEVGIQDDAVPVNEGSTFRRYVVPKNPPNKVSKIWKHFKVYPINQKISDPKAFFSEWHQYAVCKNSY